MEYNIHTHTHVFKHTCTLCVVEGTLYRTSTYCLLPYIYESAHASPIYAYTWRSDALFTGDQQYQRHARRDNNYSIFSEKHRNRRCIRPSKAFVRGTHLRMKEPKFPVAAAPSRSARNGTFTVSLLCISCARN